MARKPVPRSTILEVCERANYACEGCGRGCGDFGGSEIHHKKFRSAGGSNEPNNLALLCTSCHNKTHNGDPELARFRTKRWQAEGESEADLI